MTTSREDITALNRRFLDAVNSGNLDAIDDLLAPDFVEHDPFPGKTADVSGIKEGLSELRAAFPDLKLAIEDEVVEGDKSVLRRTMTGTHRGVFMGIPATGKAFSIEMIDIVRVENGKTAEHWGLIDSVSMLVQLGVMEPPGS